MVGGRDVPSIAFRRGVVATKALNPGRTRESRLGVNPTAVRRVANFGSADAGK